MQNGAKVREFWSWFTANEDRLFGFKEIDVRLAGELAEQLTTVAQGLTFEMGPKGSPRQLVVSAGGLYDLMDTVTALVAEAPELPRWVITPFRQPKHVGEGTLEIHDRVINLANVQCSLERELRKVAIVLYFDDLVEDELENWGEIGFLLLDATLGEYRVMTEVGSVDFASRDDAASAETSEGRMVFPLSELESRFSAMCAAYRAELEHEARLPIEQRLAATGTLLKERDEQRWQAVAAEELESEELVIQYSFFTTDEQRAGLMGTALIESEHEDVGVERTHTLLGPGYSVIGSFRREVTSAADLTEISDYLLDTAKEHEVELDGYALQRAADLSDLDLFAMGAQQLLHAGRAAEAVQFCEEGLAQHGPHLELLALLAYSSIKNGDLETAERVMDELYPMLDPDGSAPAMVWNVACACALLDRKEEALEMLRQAIDSNPEFIELARSEADLDSLKDEIVFRELLAV